ncbi:EamA family transporter [Paenibacillus glucanolyticus]|uniref:EamA family transporter n=1 Tax=Paenibacillus glucanolyticus TaxID=59843 RepID=UPI0036BADBC3
MALISKRSDDQILLINHKIAIGFILCSAFITSIGQALWKVSEGTNLFLVLFGLILYIFGAAFMIIAYKYGKLSVLQPLLCAGYIFSIFIGFFFLNEDITLQKFMGIAIISFGAIMIGVNHHD